MSRGFMLVDFTFGVLMFILGGLALDAERAGDWIGVTGFSFVGLLLCARFAIEAPRSDR